MRHFAETILVKTSTGRAEVDTRTHALSSLERLLLILADGRRTVGDMARETGHPCAEPEFQRALRVLERGRYIDRLEEIGSITPASRPYPGGRRAETGRSPLSMVQRSRH